MKNQPLWMWCLFPSVSMSLGWMLRGTIGGGFLGALIPGAMVALALCLLLKRHADAGFIAAMAAVGVGFGGQETYGQTVGISSQPEMFWWAILGFFLKGGIWGLLGGAAMGIAFSRRLHKTADLLAGFALMIAGTFAGWKLVDQPKLMYFSNRLDRPREEVWFGLLLGSLLLLAWVAYRSRSTGGHRLPVQFALWGFLGGGFGFALGAAAQVWGRANAPTFPFGWWKFMEGTFGALLGLSYGYCAWRNREHIESQPAQATRYMALPAIAWAALSIAIALLLEPYFHVRFESTLSGAILLSLALFSESFAWQTAITTTYCAFALDLLRRQTSQSQPIIPEPALWTLVALSTIAMGIFTARRPRVLDTFLLLSWTATIFGLLKFYLPPSQNSKFFTLEATFVLFVVLITLWARLISAHPVKDDITVMNRRKASA